MADARIFEPWRHAILAFTLGHLPYASCRRLPASPTWVHLSIARRVVNQVSKELPLLTLAWLEAIMSLNG